MVNEHLGESPITLGDKTYVLRLTTNRMAHLERVLDCRGTLDSSLRKAGVETMRTVIHACLTVPARHGGAAPVKRLSLDEVGDLMDDSGGIIGTTAITQAYWELVVATGILPREMAEAAEVIPKRTPDPKEPEPASPSPPAEIEDVPIGSI